MPKQPKILKEDEKNRFEDEIEALCAQITQVRGSNLGADIKAKKVDEIEAKIKDCKKRFGVSRRHITIQRPGEKGPKVKVQHIMEGDPLA